MKKTLLKYILFFTACMGLSACDALFDNELPEHDLVPVSYTHLTLPTMNCV